jgi:plasmid stability protein
MLLRMSTRMIQVRHVPEEVHRTLKARAAQAGMSLSDYLLREITALAGQPTLEEVFRRIEQDGPVHLDADIAEQIRADREEREQELEARTMPSRRDDRP